MSSYGSTHSGYLHPSQYPPPHPHTQQQYPPQPPYPTTPGPPPTSQPQAFYPPTTQPQPTYSSSPSSNGGGGGGGGGQMFSSSPNAHHNMMPQDAAAPRSRRSSSLSTSQPQMPYYQSAPIMIPSANTGHYAAAPRPQAQFQHPSSSYHAPVYARRPSHASHHSHRSSHMHDPHAWADGEDSFGSGHHGPGNGALDEETLREYERKYAKDRALEKRPTLGDSLMSAVGKMGRAFGSDRR